METPLEAAVNICVAKAMERIRDLDRKHLEQLFRDNMAITCIAKDLPEMCNIDKIASDDKKLMENIYTWNKIQAKRISKLQDELNANGEKATRLKQETDALQNKLDSMHAKLDKVTHQLQAAVISANDQGEVLIESFLYGKISAYEFLADFHEKRRLAHLRKIKSERLLTITGMERLTPSMYPKIPRL